MESVNFKIDLVGNGFEDRWPKCKVLVNEQLFYNNTVKESCTIDFDIELQEDSENKLIIEYYDKDYKKDVLLDDQGQVLQSTNILIKTVTMDDIDLGMVPYYNSIQDISDPWYTQSDLPNPREEDMQISWNGRWIMEFTSPVYIWLLENF